MTGTWILGPVEGGLLYAALALYLAAAYVGIRVVGGRRRGRVLRPMLLNGTAALTLLLVAIPLRTGHAPFLSRYEVVLLASWLLAAGSYYVDRKRETPVVAAVAAPTVALLLFFAFLLVPQEGSVKPAFAVGKIAHIVLAVFGFAGFSVAAGVGALYLWQIRLLKRNPMAAVSRRGPPLERLDQLNFYAAAVGFPFLALSLLSGWLFIAVTPEIAARWWLDPTVLTTISGLLVYAVLFVARACLGWRGRRIAWLSLLGFFLAVVGFVIATYCTGENAMHSS
jgi:ABC-type uncharacterized transport system permease subunit